MKYFVIASLICLIAKHAFAVSYHEIRVVSPGGSLPTNAKYTSNSAAGTSGAINTMKNVGSTFSATNIGSVCAVGMWAFYTTQNFGEGTEDTTDSTVVRGYDPAACLSMVTYPIFRKTNSVRYLGQADKDLNGLVIYSEPLFLGGKYEYYESAGALPPTDPVKINLGTSPGVVSGVKLGSIAITGPPTASSYWRICGDEECSNNVVCIKTAGHRGLFINRNTLTDQTIKWPLIVRAIAQTTADQCDNDIHTPPVTISPRIIGKASSASSKTLEIY